MDANDVDGDGKTDLVLGNCSVDPNFISAAPDRRHSVPFILLKNNIDKRIELPCACVCTISCVYNLRL